MNLAKTAIERPIWVAVSVVLIFLLGLLSIRGLPVQLFPDIDRPHLNITVDWRSASPQEMESEITDPIEQEMQGYRGSRASAATATPASPKSTWSLPSAPTCSGPSLMSSPA